MVSGSMTPKCWQLALGQCGEDAVAQQVRKLAVGCCWVDPGGVPDFGGGVGLVGGDGACAGEDGADND